MIKHIILTYKKLKIVDLRQNNDLVKVYCYLTLEMGVTLTDLA
jgi:hypothetical protein